jgi:hypothetical protein
MTANMQEPTTHTTTPDVNWTTYTMPDGHTFTTAHLGEITVNGVAVHVHVDLDAAWVDRRGDGTPSLTSIPANRLLVLAYYTATRDIDPAALLAAAPAAVLQYRPNLAR